MPRDPTQYGGFQDEPDPLEELQALDWSYNPGLLIEEAASLIHEAWSNPELGEERSLDELLAEVPPEFLEEVALALLQMKEEPRYQPERGLLWDLERIDETVGYVESMCGLVEARQLTQVVTESSTLSLRQMTGNQVTYDDHTHERYVQCVLDLRDTVESKQAMSDARWDNDQLREALRHEVNRMAYRLNLEIQDRLLQQITYGGRLARLAREQNLSEETVEALATEGAQTAEWASGRRNMKDPTAENIYDAANAYTHQVALEIAIEERDEIGIRELLQLHPDPHTLDAMIESAMARMGPNLTDAINQAAEAAAHWADEDIREGGLDYHVQFGNLEYSYSNQEREEWLRQTGQQEQRARETGDCVTRAINEAIGRGQYGAVRRSLNESMQTQYPDRHLDADDGIHSPLHRAVMLEYGLQPVMLADSTSDQMRNHLDLREIPTLLAHLFPNDRQPLVYVACTENHAEAVVNGVLHDIHDRRLAGDDPDRRAHYALTELWIRCDDPETLSAAQEIIARYRDVRRFDDALTYGQLERETSASQ